MDQTGKLNRHDTRYGSSLGGRSQAPVRETSEGDQRQGMHASRGAVSPLGGVSNRQPPTGPQGLSGKIENEQQITHGGKSSGRSGMAG